MANGAVCGKCNRGRIQNGVCPVCGFRETTSGNALANLRALCGGRYVIESVLGEGGYGITYVASDLKERRKVALKEFFPRFAMRRSPNGIDVVCTDAKRQEEVAHARIRFIEEANLLVRLKPIKEIVDVYHCFEENNTAYYTMELLQGMDLQKHLRTYGAMNWSTLGPIVISILRALHVTHSIGYIHRDVTPDNIFLLQQGGVRLIDFGNARRFQANQPLTAIVKEKFAPPEQFQKGNQGPWTDLYSLSVTIYYALTGELPTKGAALPPLNTRLSSIPPEVSKAVEIGMQPDSSKRYQSVADYAYVMFPHLAILGGLDIFGSQSSRVPQRPAVPPAPEPPRQKPVNQAPPAVLVCIQGMRKGLRLTLPAGRVQTLGRGESHAIPYPEQASGISRNQCAFLLHTNGAVYVRDDNSRYGTFVNGARLTPLQWRPLNRGDLIQVGKESYTLK